MIVCSLRVPGCSWSEETKVEVEVRKDINLIIIAIKHIQIYHLNS